MRRPGFLLLAAALGLAAGPSHADERPNVVVILLDDLGYSDLGCYGGEISTPNIDRLAAGGLKFARFYNASRCCPTRASLLTGRYPHQVGLARNGRTLSRESPTLAELLRAGGYQTAMVGKWHLSETAPFDGKPAGAAHLAWLNHQAEPSRAFADPASYPVGRGFERHYGPIWGVVDYFDPFSLVEGTRPVPSVPPDYYLTDALNARAVEEIRTMSRSDRPFFLYLAHCAPHWPLHARPEDIARYRETYRGGWQALRRERFRRQVELVVVDPARHALPELTGPAPAWEDLDPARQAQEADLMAVHAAMVDRVDQGVGDLVKALKEAGRFENTALFVLADNGASPERYRDPGFDRASETRDGRPIRYSGRFDPGPETTWGYIGPSWASAANTPFRYWKAESFEGGCHTPLIVHWPRGLKPSSPRLTSQPGHVMDLTPTCLELAGLPTPALEGISLAPTLRGQPQPERAPMFFEHEGGRAVVAGRQKLVAHPRGPWELYDLEADPCETRNLAAAQPDRVARLARLWDEWAARVGLNADPAP